MKYIALAECTHNHLYLIKARHAGIGVFRADERAFVISRHKFGDNFLFLELHWDTGEPFGTVKPYEDLGESAIRYDGDQERLLGYLNEQTVVHAADRKLIERFMDESLEEGLSPLSLLRFGGNDPILVDYCETAIRRRFGDHLTSRAADWLREIGDARAQLTSSTGRD